MGQVIAHRGPDGDGVHAFAGGGLVHRRLSIVDLTQAASQPLSSPDGKVVISFNGEVYNFRSVRRELEALGHTFRSTGDTEVVLHAYLQWGLDAVARMDGMFAFAMWDGRSRQLLLARDRMGKKPLYIYEDDSKMLFGSEIKALWEHGGVDRSMNVDAPAQFLSHGFVPSPHTFYRAVRKLPPAHYQVFREGRACPAQAYWDLPVKAPKSAWKPAQVVEAKAQTRQLFLDAVKKRLVADVPLGAFLSGGIDSTLVVGAMAMQSSAPVKTFSIGFEGPPEWDETAYAAQTAQRFGCDHTTFKVAPENLELVEKLAWHCDEPFGDASIIPTFVVSSLTQTKVKVALTGDGGDELFAGYARFLPAAAAEHVPEGLRETLHTALSFWPEAQTPQRVDAKVRRMLFQATKPMAERLRGWLTAFSVDELSRMLRPQYALSARVATVGREYAEAARTCASASPLNQALYINARTYLLDDLNVKMDRASMAASLEARAPFLDTALVEHAFSLPGYLKLRGRTTKWILKEAFPDLLSADVLARKKAGFGMPLGAWFRGPLRGLIEGRLLSKGARLHGIVEPEALRSVVERHTSGVADLGFHLWYLWMLDLWLEREAAAA